MWGVRGKTVVSGCVKVGSEGKTAVFPSTRLIVTIRIKKDSKKKILDAGRIVFIA